MGLTVASKKGLKINPNKKSASQILSNNWQLYSMLLIPVGLLILFSYVPMYGAVIAFQKYNLVDGIAGSEWVGLRWFERFIKLPDFGRILSNTLILNIYSLAMGVPLSIILALSFNYVRNKKFLKTVQMTSYMPNFISIIVLGGMIFQLFNPQFGVLGQFLTNLTGKQIDIMQIEGAFRHIYVWSGVWQGMGFSSIMYVSVLSSVSPELHEAAVIDGASIVQRIRHIDIPALLPTVIIQMILNTGGLLNTGFEKVLLFQNTYNQGTSQVIDSYVYTQGLAAALPNPSYAAAIGLFKSLICFILLVIVNKVAKKVGESSLW